nr:hypothetical protein [Streptomyces cyaneus]
MLTEIMLVGAARRESAVDVKPGRLRELLVTHAGERGRPHQVPLTLDDLIDRMLDRERTTPSQARWSEMVRAHLYGSGLLAPDAPDEHPFSHKLLDAYFAARHWLEQRPRPDERDVREIAENCMKSHAEDHALFCAEHLVRRSPRVVLSLLTSWSARRRRPAAVMVAKLARDGVPVPEALLAPTLKTLASWAAKVKGATPRSPGPSPSLPDEPGWPEWAAAQLGFLRFGPSTGLDSSPP